MLSNCKFLDDPPKINLRVSCITKLRSHLLWRLKAERYLRVLLRVINDFELALWLMNSAKTISSDETSHLNEKSRSNKYLERDLSISCRWSTGLIMFTLRQSRTVSPCRTSQPDFQHASRRGNGTPRHPPHALSPSHRSVLPAQH